MFQQDPNRSIFVGNIPYDATEQSVRECFESFNLSVKNVRITYDRNTGKPKGIAFVEFYDTTSAQNAEQQVNNQRMNGRQLKVTAYDPNFPSRHAGFRPSTGSAHGRMENVYRTSKSDTCRSTLMNAALHADTQIHAIFGHTQPIIPNELTQALYGLSKDQLFDVLTSFKALDQEDSSKARNLLLSQPALSRILFHAEIVLGLIRQQPLPTKQDKNSRATHLFSPVYDVSPKINDVQSATTSHSSHIHRYTSPLTPSNYDTQDLVKMEIPEPSATSDSTVFGPAQQQALNAVINMTHAQINQLPMEKREAVFQIRQQLGISF